MSKMIIFGFIIPLLLQNADALKGNCNKDEDLLQRCSMALPVLSSPEISFALTREELDKSCVELRAGIKCIDNYTEVCMKKSEQVMFRSIYAGIIDVIQELCSRGKYQDEYLRHADCVKKVRSEYEVCSKKYEVTLTTVSNYEKKDQYHTDQTGVASSHEDYLRTVCCSFQEYLMCSERTVQRSCGDEAALFTSAFLKRMASKIIKNFCLEYRGQECGLSDAATAVDQSLLLFTFSVIAVLTPHIKSLLT
ncbi:uncharacterized protein LOC116774273 isoform X2 [Danaus plexippus]|uniref:Uncharacterized protein n=1 Tax=Danaus plexippus plexippus TaxID=278856 RepID=A0A212F5J4_DANPL|nr:uncharacterized protein LOC116774273 isoform X2 [Danaus plexippus]OWR48979.1 hypothetical protein KGM_209271 [Danaus plexippus plexippus]